MKNKHSVFAHGRNLSHLVVNTGVFTKREFADLHRILLSGTAPHRLRREKMSIRTILFLVLALSVQGCKPKPTAPDPMTLPYEHRVQYHGETLGIISKWYTGSFDNWKAIKDANPGMDERRLRMGSVILIPREVMVKITPLPRSAIGATATLPKTNPQPVTTIKEIPLPEEEDNKPSAVAPVAGGALDLAEAPATPPTPEPTLPTLDTFEEEAELAIVPPVIEELPQDPVDEVLNNEMEPAVEFPVDDELTEEY